MVVCVILICWLVVGVCLVVRLCIVLSVFVVVLWYCMVGVHACCCRLFAVFCLL